jgi:hypothetical protein
MLLFQNKRVANQNTFITRLVHAKGESTNLVGSVRRHPFLDEHGNAAAQTRGETPGSHHGDVDMLASEGEFGQSTHGSTVVVVVEVDADLVVAKLK